MTKYVINLQIDLNKDFMTTSSLLYVLDEFKS